MKSIKPEVGGYVRITQDGRYAGVPFNKDEIWKVTNIPNSLTTCLDARHEESGRETRLSLIKDSTYPIECVWIGMNKEVPINNTYEIY